MVAFSVTYERLPVRPGLGRHVRHDSRSAAYPVDVSGAKLVTTWWTRHLEPLDQDGLGSCTGNAGIGNMATEPYYQTLAPTRRYASTETGAVALYSAATKLDTYPGTYPPDDTGSDGLAIAQALKAAGEISGYVHAFDGPTARLALTQAPGIVGIKWYDGMFDPAPSGEVTVSGALAGGHELSFDGIDVEAARVWFTNSWGPTWGVIQNDLPGRAWMSFTTFDGLIADGGDFIQFTPITAPAPVPVPVPPGPGPVPDPTFLAACETFRTTLAPFAQSNGLCSRKVRAAGRVWLAAEQAWKSGTQAWKALG